jgi:membrane protein DedA with SNARE-associated domain
MAPAPPLPGVFADLAPLLNHYGYLAIVALITVESFGVPAPGQTLLTAAGVYAGAGQLDLGLVAGLALLSATGGDSVGFAIGRYGGRKLVLRYGRYVFITEDRLEKAEKFFDRYGGKIVLVARFFDGLRQVNGVIAGLTGLRFSRFLIFNAIGAALWAGLWSGLGFLAGRHLQQFYGQLVRLQLYLLAAAVLVAGFFAARLLIRRRRSSEANDARAAGSLS